MFADGKWHLRTSAEDSRGANEKLMVFTGSVRSEDQVRAEGRRLESGAKETADTLTPHAEGQGFDFRFATFGAKDEAEFTAGPKGKAVKVKLLIDGQKAVNHVLIGRDGRHPEKNEFTLPATPAPRNK
jgi:hypothetical protein